MNNEGPTRTVTLPPRFYDDHADRDLPAGRVIGRTRKSVTVELTAAEWTELRSDADHYANSNAYGDPEFRGLIASARATLRRLT